MVQLKLRKLPDRLPVKVTVSIPPDLHEALGAYADLYSQTYGVVEPVHELIPAILSSFLESDRGFVAHRKKGAQ